MLIELPDAKCFLLGTKVSVWQNLALLFISQPWTDFETDGAVPYSVYFYMRLDCKYVMKESCNDRITCSTCILLNSLGKKLTLAKTSESLLLKN